MNNPSFLQSSYIFMLITFFNLNQECHGGPHERRLLSNLLYEYNPLERPVINESEPILVSFHLTLQQIIDLDEKNQILQSSIWLNMEWIDTNLRWNTSEYPGVKNIRISASKVWTPDVLLYNSADDKIDSSLHTNVVVESNGSCLWVPPGIFKSTCKVDITWFPFDDQKCLLKFGSWTYDGLALDLRLSNEEGGEISTYIPSGEWILIGVPARRRVLQYACCPETYVDITFTIHIRRRTLYYTFNLIVPCVLISSMTLLGFALPPDSGEKLTLGVTILLSMTVFMLQLSETLPPTSESISIIGTYFACIMIMVAFSVVMTVVVLNFHHRATSEYQEMPPLVRRVILVWLPWILRMEKPGIPKPPPSTSKTKSGTNVNVELSTSCPTNNLSMPLNKGQQSSHSNAHTCRPGDLSYTISSNLKGYCDPIGRLNNFQHNHHNHHHHLLHHHASNHTTPNKQHWNTIQSAASEGALHLGCHEGLSTGLDDHLTNLIGNRTSLCLCCTAHQQLASANMANVPMPTNNPTNVNNIVNNNNSNNVNSNNLSLKSNQLKYGTTLFDPSGAASCPGYNGLPCDQLNLEPGSLEAEDLNDGARGGTSLGLGLGDTEGTTSLLNESPGHHQVDYSQSQPCCSFICKGREINAILREIRFITNRMRKEDEIEEIIGEWKFAAMVMDRLCLIVFSSFTAISTAACLIPPANLH
ncbi:neuronal acetylcholine receptor subunit alpha-7-like [Tetranychus urticae]|uniref:neuronal acetylcholine receptor subunit alpha-7-like n=1 Tax=Tetranychus urticae TaxID=32264 RepID=UPI00077C0AE1|nr:neuronal acetylcholine receptor subunit alpha-7-like [Tetranychus urticae]